jgi:hypothetical protein
MMSRVEPPLPDPTEPQPARRSSFEDYEIPDPAAAIPVARRPAVVSTATLVLFIAGAMNIAFALLFPQPGSAAPIYVLLGVAQLVASVLLFLMLPIGRIGGLVMGGIGIVLGLIQATDAPASGLMSMALNAFVVWAVVASGPAFRRG